MLIGWTGGGVGWADSMDSIEHIDQMTPGQQWKNTALTRLVPIERKLKRKFTTL